MPGFYGNLLGGGGDDVDDDDYDTVLRSRMKIGFIISVVQYETHVSETILTHSRIPLPAS